MSEPPRRRKHCRISAMALVSVLIVAIVSPPAPCSSRTEKNQDIVFLVDITSSMRDAFDNVKRAVGDYVLDARVGDNVVIITFGEMVTLKVRQGISSKEDLKLIERELRAIEPTEYYTNMWGALDKGLKELQRFDQRYPDHLRTLVLVSDGTNKPREGVSSPPFEAISKRYQDTFNREDADFAFYYLSLGTNPDPQVMLLLEDIGGRVFDLRKDVSGTGTERRPFSLAQVFVQPASMELGTVPGTVAVVPVPLRFLPGRGNPGTSFITTTVSARFRDNPSWRAVVEAKPSRLPCSAEPWDTTMLFSIDCLEEGTVIGTLELKPERGQVLFIEPSKIPVTMNLLEPTIECEQQERLVFGPIAPHTEFRDTQRIPLILNAAASEVEIEADADIEMPDGMSLTTRIEGSADNRRLAVRVAAEESFGPGFAMSIEGAIHVACMKDGIALSSDTLEVLIYVAPPTRAGGFIIGGLKRFFSRLGGWVGLAAVGIVLIVVGGLVGYWCQRLRPQSALEGKLLLVGAKGRAKDELKRVKLNLNSIGKSLGRDSLIIGSSKEAGITLAHKSVSDCHCELSARMDEGKKRIFLEPISSRTLMVNGEEVTEATPLSDRDIIQIGVYTFRFENPHPYKQIVVRYLDGRILKGTPTTWDIESRGFHLLPRDALPGSKEETLILFKDLKAVYFVRDFDGHIGKKMASRKGRIRGVHMELTFQDGEKMEGSTSETYDPGSPRFYFFPADQSGNAISLLVERENLKDTRILTSSA